MAHIRNRTLKDGRKAYLVVWIDPAGKEKSKQFPKKGDTRTPGTAVHFKTQIEAELSRGTYIDPNAGQITFRQYAEEWRNNLHGRPSYEDRLDSILALHVYPVIGDMRMGAVRRRDLQALVKTLTSKTVGGRRGPDKEPRRLAASYIENIVNIVAMIFRAAVVDDVIPASPVKQLKLPEVEDHEIVIPTTAQVLAVAERITPRFALAVLGAAGTGLRSGELRGLDKERVRILEGRVRVDRQLVTPDKGACYLAPPKTKAGVRDVPLQPNLVQLINRHLEQYGWGTAGDPAGTSGLLLTNRLGRPVKRQSLNDHLRPILTDMGFPERSGMHLFRHYYASLLIYNGEDPKTVQVRMGHATIAETMDTYGHLWPDHEDRSGSAVDAIFEKALTSPSQVRESVTGPSIRGRKVSTLASHASYAQQVSG